MKIIAYNVFLLHFITVTAQECTVSTQGNVRIIGTVTSDLIAGRLEICIGGRWRAVYDDSWGAEEAAIICTGKGFPDTGAMACGSSCFGASSAAHGFTGFTNCINQNSIFSCGVLAPDGHFPDINAGVVCIRPNEDMTTPCLATCCPDTPFPTSCLTTPTQCPTFPSVDCSTCPRTDCSFCPTTCSMLSNQTEATPTSTSNSQDSPVSGTDSQGEQANQMNAVINISIITSLGGLSAFLILILVCVVSGWVCSCYRGKASAKRGMMEIIPSTPIYTQAPQLSPTEVTTEPNPSYTPVAANPSLNPTGVYYSTMSVL